MLTVSLVLSLLTLGAEPKFDKFACDDKCKNISEICFVGCEQEGKEARRNGEKPPNCKDLCEPAIKKCDDMCKQFETAKAKAGNAKGKPQPSALDEDGH